MAKYSIYALLTATVMALLYVTMAPTAPTSGDCSEASLSVSQQAEKDCTTPDSSQQEQDGGISWPAWLVGTESIQFHYLDLLELLFSSTANEPKTSKSSSSTAL